MPQHIVCMYVEGKCTPERDSQCQPWRRSDEARGCPGSAAACPEGEEATPASQGAPERERRREEERSGDHAKMRTRSQTHENVPRSAASSGHAGIWSRPRNAPGGHQRPPERKIFPETCSRLERSAGGLETLPEACREQWK